MAEITVSVEGISTLTKYAAELEKQITDLKADLADIEGELKEAEDKLHGAAKAFNGTLDKMTERFKQDFDKYAGHTAECEISRKSYFVRGGLVDATGEGKGWRKAKCTCGLEQARERWE